MSKKPRKKQKPHGEDLLASLESISIKLEDGQTYTFNMGDELCVPNDPAAVVLAHRRCHARLAFWSAQTDRAMHAVRKERQACAEVEGQADMYARKYIHEDTEFPVTEKAVQSYVDQRTEVKKARIKLRSAEKQFDLLRTVKSALEHRCFILGRMFSAQEVKAVRD